MKNPVRALRRATTRGEKIDDTQARAPGAILRRDVLQKK
jgi:hypothetical protein